MHEKIAVFGANGYLGGHILSHLIGQGEICDGFDLAEQSRISMGKYYKCDINDESFWEEFNPTDYKTVIFLSGLSGPEKSFVEADKFIDVNVSGLLSLLKRLAPLGREAPMILFPSSRLVYKGGETVTENSLLSAKSVYAASKIACECLLGAYYARYDVPYCALRICVPYGNLLPYGYSYGTIGFFVSQVQSGQPITVYGDGDNRKTYTYIGDICQIFSRISISHIESGIYNVGGFDYSLMEVAEMVAKKYGGKVISVPWPENAMRVEMGSISMNAEKLDTALGGFNYKYMKDCVL